MQKIGLISDTHGYWEEKLYQTLADCDEIWHAGDIGNMDIADKMEAFKPVRAVFGNIDDGAMRRRYAETLDFELEGVRVLMTHIGGRPPKYNKTALNLLQLHQPQLFIVGHSHILLVQYDAVFGCLHLNPGALGIEGWHKQRTAMTFVLNAGKIEQIQVVDFGLRGKL